MPEPSVVTEDIRAVVRQAVRPGDPDEGEAVAVLAERADTSTRTVYRVLNPPAPKAGVPHTISLALADRLVMSAGRTLGEVAPRMVVGGAVLNYGDA